jgi:ribonuclease J
VRIIPLGGVGEIGKNMTVLEYGNNIIVVDCGVMFPDGVFAALRLVDIKTTTTGVVIATYQPAEPTERTAT